MKLPEISADTLDALEAVTERCGSAAVKRFMDEQSVFCRRAFEISQSLGWGSDQFSAAMTICRLAFDALRQEMESAATAQARPLKS